MFQNHILDVLCNVENSGVFENNNYGLFQVVFFIIKNVIFFRAIKALIMFHIQSALGANFQTSARCAAASAHARLSRPSKCPWPRSRLEIFSQTLHVPITDHVSGTVLF